MKKFIVMMLIGSFLISCNSGSEGEDAIRSEISKYQNQVLELNKKIKEMEAQLPEGIGNSNSVNSLKVRTQKVSPQPFSKYFTATGELEAINEAFISPEVSGQITSIHVKEGQKVSKGQLLAKLSTSLIEKNIGRFHVAVKDALGMRVMQCVSELRADQANGLPPVELGEAFALKRIDRYIHSLFLQRLVNCICERRTVPVLDGDCAQAFQRALYRAGWQILHVEQQQSTIFVSPLIVDTYDVGMVKLAHSIWAQTSERLPVPKHMSMKKQPVAQVRRMGMAGMRLRLCKSNRI